MALKDARRQVKLGSACSAEGILKVLQSSELSGLSSLLKTYLVPLLGNSGTGKENDFKTELHKLAREFVPFLLQFLKACGIRLASLPLSGDSAARATADQLFSSMAMGLDGLSQLRSFLTGCTFEIEIQRYGLIRRLMTWKNFSAALAQCQTLFQSLCQLNSITPMKVTNMKQTSKGRTAKGGSMPMKTALEGLSLREYVLGPPEADGQAEGLPALTVSAVIDFIWCAAEGGTDSPGCIEKIAGLPEQLAPWISLLDAGNAVKQRDALFRALYKCTLVLVAQPTQFGTNLVQHFCKLTLEHCTSSSQCNQYAKVARKFCTSLSSVDANGSRTAVEVCSTALCSISSKAELEGVRRSIQVLELVDWFSRSCQATNQVDYGWRQVYSFVCPGQQVSLDIPMAVAGLYGVGLLFMKLEAEQCQVTEAQGSRVNSLKQNGYMSEGAKREPSLSDEACFLLHCTEEVLHSIELFPSTYTLGKQTNERTSWNLSVCERWRKQLSGLGEEGDEFQAKLFLGIARALQYLQKPSMRYAQTVWNEYIAGSHGKICPLYANINAELTKILKLCCPIIERGIRCPGLNENDRDILSKSFQLLPQISVAALRLSLLHNNEIQEIFATVTEGIQHLLPEEQLWLMSAAYNMGVQLFNAKQYSLACWPLELAYKAACARINLTFCPKNADLSRSEILSEACAKCAVLADARNRNGEPGKSKLVLIDGIEIWARVQSVACDLQAPHALVKSFVKLICVEMKSSRPSYGEGRICMTSLGLFGALQPLLPPGTVGLLLEEELAVCKILMEQFPEETRKLEADILDCLLERVYTGDTFLVQKSVLLLDKSRGARLRDSGNLPSCVKDVSEALGLMEAALKNGVTSASLPEIFSFRRHMAMAYSMKAIYTYELNPHSQDFYAYAVKSLDTWKHLLELIEEQGSLCETQNPWCALERDEKDLVLLLSLIDLLHIQGYSALLIHLHELILKLSVCLKQPIPTTEWLCSIMNSPMSHLLCPVLSPLQILSHTREFFDSRATPLEYWQNNMRLYPGSIMEVQHMEIEEIVSCQCGAKKDNSRRTEELEVVEKIKKMVNFTVSDGQKSSRIVLQSAGLRYIIAGRAFEKGELTEAIKYANEAYRLRSKLFKRIFRGFEKRTPQNSKADNLSVNQEVEVLMQREVPASVASSSWPFTVKVQQLLSIPSQWRILGDYVESLMQVGVIYEKMGAADDAERVFREGHRIAAAQNLPMVVGWFSSSLGEVYRKRLMWESAENHLIKAKEVFERLDVSAYCESCIITGKALLEMRIGDLVRHNWYYQQEQRSSSSTPGGLKLFLADNLMDALSCYTAATVTLSVLSGGRVESNFVEKVSSTSNSESKQRKMLSTLREHGKEVSNKIMANAVEDTAHPAGSRARKPRLRRSMQTRNSTWIDIGPDESHEENLDALCEDLSLASLLADEEKSSRPPGRRTRSLVKPGEKGAKGKASSSQGGNEFAEHPLHTRMTKRSLKMKGEIVRNIKDNEFVKIGLTQVDEGHCSTNQIGGALRLLSVEESPRHVWNQHLRKLFVRVLLQRGKCLAHLEQLSEAADVYQTAISTLYASCASCLSNESTCSSAPVEEGAILYHMSRLLLQRNQDDESSRQRQGSQRRGGDDLGTHKLEVINRLYRAFNLCHQIPPMLRKIAKLLAILYAGLCQGSSPSSPGLTFSGLEAVELAAYFHQISLGTTMRQQHLAALDSKVSEKSLNCLLSSSPYSSDYLRKMQQALRIVPLSGDNLGDQVKEFLSSLPPLSVCCISFVDEADVNLVGRPCCSTVESYPGPTVFLLVTRFTYQSTPVVALLPIGPLHTSRVDDVASTRAGASASNPYCLSDDDETSCSEEDSSPTVAVQSSSGSSQRILEKVADEFRCVLEESRRSTSGSHPVATPEEKSLWWKWRMQLDRRLEALVRKIEDSWLRHHKCLLLGEPKATGTTRSFDIAADRLVDMLVSVGSSKRQSGNKTVNCSFVKSLLKGVGSFTDSEVQRAITNILGWKDYCLCGSYDADSEDCRKCRCETLDSTKRENLQRLSRAFREAFNNMYINYKPYVTEGQCDENIRRGSASKQPKNKTGRKKKGVPEVIPDVVVENIKTLDAPVKREPLQLILDSDTQALPWESLPVIREYEVYRMPSLGNVHAMYIQHQFENMTATQLSRNPQETNRRKLEKSETQISICADLNRTPDLPLEVTFINPYNTYYVLNPSGDLKSTQLSFEDWFMHRPGWKGKAGTAPTAEEFKKGLQEFDLFVYLGHGTGDQFLPERFVRQLDQCAATLLMGCSSGRLSPRGQYEPFGTVLSYLMAGCPAVIANLWDVTDGDIDRFSKFLLHKWMSLEPESAGKDESKKGVLGLGDCERPMKAVSDADEEFETSIDVVQSTGKVLPKGDVIETVRLSSAVGQSRKACRLPYLIGASPVCYGVPTGLRKQALSAKVSENLPS